MAGQAHLQHLAEDAAQRYWLFQVYDIRAIRILVPTVADCYATWGLVHGLWHNIPHEFDDYIANPKENGYRSCIPPWWVPRARCWKCRSAPTRCTRRRSWGLRPLALQGHRGEQSSRQHLRGKIAWLRQVLDWHEETGDTEDVAEQFSFQMAQDRGTCFTPQGDVVNLAHGATRWILPTTCTPKWGIAAVAPR